MRVEAGAGKAHRLRQEMAPGLVVTPHARADAQRRRRLTLCHPARAAPCAHNIIDASIQAPTDLIVHKLTKNREMVALVATEWDARMMRPS